MDEEKNNEMDEKDIEALFDRVAEHFDGEDDGARGMFTMLVNIALKYRDMLTHSTGSALTVGETRQALDAFMDVLRTHEVPKMLDKRVHDLVLMWLEEIKEKVHH